MSDNDMIREEAGIEEKIQRPPNPLEGASLFSRLTFSWPLSLIRKGLEEPLEEKDIPEILEEEDSDRNRKKFEAVWQDEVKSARKAGRRPSLHLALVKLYLRSLWFVQPAIVVTSTSRIGQALSLGRLIESFGADSGGKNWGYAWATVLIACTCIPLISHHQIYFRNWRMGIQLRIGAVAAIYFKSLKLDSVGGSKTVTAGELSNLASNDVERFLFASLFLTYLVWAPLEMLAVLFVGIRHLGPAFAAGYGVLFTFVLAQFFLGQQFAKFRSRTAVATDQRVSLVSQAIQGVRIMKMSGWELQFAKSIENAREKEILTIQKASRYKALNEAIYFVTNVSVAIVVLMVHVLTGNLLTPQNVFTTFSLINLIQFTMTKFFAYAVMSVSECYVSVRRIQQFLELPEIEEKEFFVPETDRGRDSPLVSIHGVSAYWDLTTETGASATALNSHFVKNHDSPNIGVPLTSKSRTPSPVPSGSSQRGSLSTDGSQKSAPHLENSLNDEHASVPADDEANSDRRPNREDSFSSRKSRESIVTETTQRSVALENVSLELNKGQLYCVIGSVGCGKSSLLSMLAGELLPNVGDIVVRTKSIAYAAQDPWMMDGTVRENITMGKEFNADFYMRVIEACGLRPDIERFPSGDQTLVGDRGVQCSGGQRARIGLARVLYRDVDLVLLDDPLSAVDSRVARLIFRSAIQGLCISKGKCVVLATHQYQLIGEETCVLMKRGNVIQVAPYGDCVGRSGDQKLVRDSMKRKSRELASLSPDNWKHEASINLPLPGVGDPYESADSSQRETKDSGAVSWNTWMDYVSAMGGKWVVLSMLVLFLFTQGWLLTTITYIGIWAEKPFQEQRSFSFLLLIGLLGLSAVGLSMVRSTIGFFLTLRASRNLHDNMTFAVLRSKIVFFDTNPLGRILNRFSADVGSNDDQLSSSLNDTFAIGFMVIGAVVTAAVVMPFLLITIPPIFFYFYRTRRMFITSSRELKRLEGIARSPLYAMMSESIKGISSIRANGATKYFQQRFAVVQNAHSRAFFSFISLTRWLNFRLEAIQILLIGTASLLAVLFSTNGWLNVGPSTLGLALTLLMQLSGLLQWAIRQSSEVINQMVSVERVAAFTKLEPEPPLETERDIQIGEWPSSGSMNVHDLTVRYRDDLPPALSKFSFKIDGGMRVGVVGRTGGGKSTLLQSIFRLLQAETGVITVDHIDISSLGLHKLRKSMSVIPQTPVLFSGWTLRDNLDPFGKHDNSEILDVIASVQMQNVCEDLPAGLNTIVAENGSNFSVGQRQLFCVARAILQKNKIVVLDEPTANVDNKTDVMLQRAVATSFPGATVIAIAHRLDTIIDYDRIIVVGNGKMLECGTPYELLCKSNGHFAAMVTETGEATAAELRERAIVKARSGNGHKQVAIY